MEKSFRAASVIPVGSAEDLKYTSIVRPPTLGKGIGTRPQSSTTFISSKDASMLNSSANALSPGGNQLPSILKKTTTNVKVN